MKGLFALALTLSLTAFAGDTELGAVLPDSASKVGEYRYRIKGNIEDALKFYKSVYPPREYPRKSIANQPGVKAVHIVNPSGKGDWEGINIYETSEETRLFVVPSDAKLKKREKLNKSR